MSAITILNPWGLFIVLLGFTCTAIGILVWPRLHWNTQLRRIPSLDALTEAVNVCANRGRPMIYTQGGLSTESGQFQSLFMAGLICLQHETKLAAALRVRVITVSGNPRAVMLQQQFSSSGYSEGGHPEMYNMTDFRFFPSLPALGFGLQALVQTENAGALIGIGSHDLSSHIPAFESATAQGALTISCELWASDISSSSLVCDYTILQEEAMAAAAYLSTDEATRASIMGQDLFKIINVVILITLAVVFTTSGLKLF